MLYELYETLGQVRAERFMQHSCPSLGNKTDVIEEIKAENLIIEQLRGNLFLAQDNKLTIGLGFVVVEVGMRNAKQYVGANDCGTLEIFKELNRIAVIHPGDLYSAV